MNKLKYDIFISYRREGGYDTAQLLYDRLTQMRYRVSFDLETLRGGKFNTQLYQRIEQCSDVLVIMSKDSLNLRENSEDDWFRLEIAHALKCGKNIVPVFLRDFNFPNKSKLPPDIAGLVEYQGVTASQEHFDSVLQRICRNLKARPRHHIGRVIGIIASALVLAAGIGIGFNADIVFPYPYTRVAKQHTADMLRMVVTSGMVYDSLLNAEMAFLSSAEAALESRSVAAMESAYGQFVHTLETLPFDRCVPTAETLMNIDEMPVNKADFYALCMAPQDGEVECRQTAVTIKNLFYGILSKSDESRLRKYIADNKAMCGLKGEMFAYGLLDLLQNISDAALKEVGLGRELGKGPDKWIVLGPLLVKWERDPYVLNNLQESVMSRMEGVVNNLAVIVVDAQKDYEADKKKFYEAAKSIGLSDVQIGERIEESERNAVTNVIQRLYPPQ